MSERKKLSRYSTQFRAGSAIEQLWQSAKPADDLKPIPSRRVSLPDHRRRTLFNARSGTAGYKLTLEVLEGEHAGRRLWHDIWITEAATSLAKRDLGKLGVTSLEQLERPLPEGIIIDARVALRRGDDGDGIQPSRTVRCRRHRARRARAVRTRRRAGRRLDGRRGRLRLADGTTGRGCRVMTARPHGFRVAGHRAGRRRLIDWRAAFAAYASCDPAAQPEREAYLSHFVFGADFADLPGAERLGSRLQRPVRGRLALLGHRPAGRPGAAP